MEDQEQGPAQEDLAAQRAAEDDLIRRYLLAEAIEWWEHESVYGWMSKM